MNDCLIHCKNIVFKCTSILKKYRFKIKRQWQPSECNSKITMQAFNSINRDMPLLMQSKCIRLNLKVGNVVICNFYDIALEITDRLMTSPKKFSVRTFSKRLLWKKINTQNLLKLRSCDRYSIFVDMKHSLFCRYQVSF